LNSWPELEVGRILRDYGEENNWHSLQKQIVKARENGGLHSTGELVELIQRKCSVSRGMGCHFHDGTARWHSLSSSFACFCKYSNGWDLLQCHFDLYRAELVLEEKESI
jgi:hypothetical protein